MTQTTHEQRKKMSKDELILEDMKRVADELDAEGFTMGEYKRHGRYTPDEVVRYFGAWLNAMSHAGLKDQKSTLTK